MCKFFVKSHNVLCGNSLPRFSRTPKIPPIPGNCYFMSDFLFIILLNVIAPLEFCIKFTALKHKKQPILNAKAKGDSIMRKLYLSLLLFALAVVFLFSFSTADEKP